MGRVAAYDPAGNYPGISPAVLMDNQLLLFVASYINAAVAFALGVALVASRRQIRRLERERLGGSEDEDLLADLRQEVLDWMDRIDAEVESLHERFDITERILSRASRHEAHTPIE